jgi:hypothetical protein
MIPGGVPSTPLWLRAPIQLFFMALAWWSIQTWEDAPKKET